MPQFTSSTFSSYTGKWLIATGVFEALLATGFLVGAFAIPDVRGGFLATAGILGATAIFLIIFGLRSRAKAAEAKRVDDTGLAGQATITGLTQTGMYLNENPQVKLDLLVQIPGRQPYQASRKEFVPLILLGRLSSGAPLPVKVDPADPSTVIIDWDAPSPPPVLSQVTPAVGGQDESLSQIQQAMQSAGLQAPNPFASAEQGNYTVDQLREYLRQNGVSGTATIDHLEDSGRTVGDERMFTMEVTVNLPGQAPRKSPRSVAMVPVSAMNKVFVGRAIPVKVAADNPDMVMFEWEKI